MKHLISLGFESVNVGYPAFSHQLADLPNRAIAPPILSNRATTNDSAFAIPLYCFALGVGQWLDKNQ